MGGINQINKNNKNKQNGQSTPPFHPSGDWELLYKRAGDIHVFLANILLCKSCKKNAQHLLKFVPVLSRTHFCLQNQMQLLEP